MGFSRSGILSDEFIRQHCIKYQAVPMAAITKVLGKTVDGRVPPRPSSFNVMAHNLTAINPQLRMDKIVDTYRDELKTVARELKVTRAELAEASRPSTPSTGSNTSVTDAETPPGSVSGIDSGYDAFSPGPEDFLPSPGPSNLRPSDVNNVGFPPQHLNLRPRDIDYMRQRARAEIARYDALQAELDAEDSD